MQSPQLKLGEHSEGCEITHISITEDMGDMREEPTAGLNTPSV